MNDLPLQPADTRQRGEEQPVTIFLVSWGRPIYLWVCLDSLWRLTQTATRVILLDNAHPDPLVGKVIEAFQRRGLFAEIVGSPRTALKTSNRHTSNGFTESVNITFSWRAM